jgi:hypothetical protein
MSFKKHIAMFLVLFISCSTSIRDQDGQQAVLQHSAVKSAHSRLLLAQVKVPLRPAGCDPGSGLRKPSAFLP